MKRLLLILALSLTLGFSAAYADNRPGNNGHHTEYHKDTRPGQGNSKKDNKKKKDHKDHKRDHRSSKPGYTYRPMPAHRPQGHHHHCNMPPMAYVIGAANVLFNGIVMPGVNMHSFQVLDYGYARDAYHVYYNGKVLKGADPATFRLLPDGYARDARHVWYCGKRVKH